MAAVVVEYLEESASSERNVHHEELVLEGSDYESEAGDVLPSRFIGAQSAAKWYEYKWSNEPSALLNPTNWFLVPPGLVAGQNRARR